MSVCNLLTHRWHFLGSLISDYVFTGRKTYRKAHRHDQLPAYTYHESRQIYIYIIPPPSQTDTHAYMHARSNPNAHTQIPRIHQVYKHPRVHTDAYVLVLQEIIDLLLCNPHKKWRKLSINPRSTHTHTHTRVCVCVCVCTWNSMCMCQTLFSELFFQQEVCQFRVRTID